MGHSEMSLAVAGFSSKEIAQRTSLLASNDWSPLTEAEQLSFHFAQHMAKAPEMITSAEIKKLMAVLGKERTLDVIWYISWCNYMTRVADSFQFPLEIENVFMPPEKSKSGQKSKINNKEKNSKPKTKIKD